MPWFIFFFDEDFFFPELLFFDELNLRTYGETIFFYFSRKEDIFLGLIIFSSIFVYKGSNSFIASLESLKHFIYPLIFDFCWDSLFYCFIFYFTWLNLSIFSWVLGLISFLLHCWKLGVDFYSFYFDFILFFWASKLATLTNWHPFFTKSVIHTELFTYFFSIDFCCWEFSIIFAVSEIFYFSFRWSLRSE